MSDNRFIPNSFQLPNAFVDELMGDLSGNAVKCYLLVARKTTGWQKEADHISISQFQAKTKIKDVRTVHSVLSELEEAGLIRTVKALGKVTEFYLIRDLPQSETSGKKCNTLQKMQPVAKNVSGVVAKNASSTSSKKCHSTKDTINTPLKTNKKTTQKKSADLDLLEEFGITGQLAEDFVQLRKSKNAPISKTALSRLEKQADLANLPLREVVEIMIERNWQGFKADWELQSGKPRASNGTTAEGSFSDENTNWWVGKTIEIRGQR